MQNMVIFRDNQELDSADLNNMQGYTRASFDSLISDAIASDSRYASFGISKTAATQATVAPGTLYVNGAVYALTTSSVIDFFSQLPLVTQKWCAIVANGSNVQTDIQPRDFLINATTGATQPQSVAMEDSRIAVLNTVAGVEAPQPSYPTTATGVVVVGYVLLTTTGIQQIVQYQPTQLPNLNAVESQVTALDNWQTKISGQVNTLDTALANLRNDIKGKAAEADLQTALAKIDSLAHFCRQLQAGLQALAVNAIKSSAWNFFARDVLLDAIYSDSGNAGFTAALAEGIFFAANGSAVATLALLNSLDASASVNSNFLLPAWNKNLRVSVSDYVRELAFATYVYQSSRSVTLLRRRRRRHRVNPKLGASPNAVLWKNGQKDPIASNFAMAGETFASVTIGSALALSNPSGANSANGVYTTSRQTAFWADEYSEPYWNRVTSSASASGQQIAQVFLNSQDGWLTHVGLFFTRAASSGDVAITICAVAANGAPDLTNAVQHISLPVASILTGSLSSGAGLPTLVETQVSIPPTFLSGGRRYAIVMTTGGAHYLAGHDDFAALQGHSFYADSTGAFVLGAGAIRLNLYYAQWEAARYEIGLQPLSLSGGIAALDFLHEIQHPNATSLAFEVQIGGAWYPLAVAGVGPNLASAPALLPLRAVFTGTSDLMPGCGLSTLSQIGLYGPPLTTFTYLSKTQTLATASKNFLISVMLVGWVAGTHTLTPTLVSGTSYTLTSFVDYLQPDGTIRRDLTFTLGSTIGSYVLNIVGGTSVAGSVFSISEIVHSAF